ncbi:MAG: hypothetical protein ACO1PW_02115 [Actinomycetota bacterium]
MEQAGDAVEGGAPVEAPARAGGTGPLRLVLLGVVLIVLGLVVRWAQDVAAPYVNLGEADMAEVVTFESTGGTYRVVSSGPSRPVIHQTVCEIETADGRRERDVGHDGMEGGQDRFGVTRVLAFDAVKGTTSVRCGRQRPDGGAGLGRFQVVDAGGPVSIAGWGLLGGGLGLGLAGAAWWALRSQRA